MTYLAALLRRDDEAAGAESPPFLAFANVSLDGSHVEGRQVPVTVIEPQETQPREEQPRNEHFADQDIPKGQKMPHRHLTETMLGDDYVVNRTADAERLNAAQYIPSSAYFFRIICPFLSTLAHVGAILLKPSYSMMELADISVLAGLDEEEVQAHIQSNFRHSPTCCIDITRMEGKHGEHLASTGCCDCPTRFFNCGKISVFLNETPGMPAVEKSLQQCDAETVLCTLPNLPAYYEFVDAADRDKDGIVTIAELRQSQEEGLFRSLDANPISTTTIAAAFTLLIKVFGEWKAAISIRALTRVVLDRLFPEHYEFPARRGAVVQRVAVAPLGKSNPVLQDALRDQSGSGNNLNIEASEPGYRGAPLELAGQHVTARHSSSLDVGAQDYRRGGFVVAFWLQPTNISGIASAVLVKKGGALGVAGNQTDVTPGWGFGQVNPSSLSYVAQDSEGGRCEGELVFNHPFDWGDFLRNARLSAHIAVMFDRSAGNVSLWLDGHRQHSTGPLGHCRGSWANMDDLSIGSAFGKTMYGNIQNFTIYNRSASAEQIRNWAAGLF